MCAQLLLSWPLCAKLAEWPEASSRVGGDLSNWRAHNLFLHLTWPRAASQHFEPKQPSLLLWLVSSTSLLSDIRRRSQVISCTGVITLFNCSPLWPHTHTRLICFGQCAYRAPAPKNVVLSCETKNIVGTGTALIQKFHDEQWVCCKKRRII